MQLTWYIIILMAGGIAAWISAQWSTTFPRWIALIASLASLLWAVIFWVNADNTATWYGKFSVPWIPTFGIGFSLAIDGLSLLMILLTFFLGVLAVTLKVQLPG